MRGWEPDFYQGPLQTGSRLRARETSQPALGARKVGVSMVAPHPRLLQEHPYSQRQCLGGQLKMTGLCPCQRGMKGTSADQPPTLSVQQACEPR